MLKILYIVTQQEFGGAQRYIFDLATNLNRSQYDIHITAGGSEGPLFDCARASNLAIHSLKRLVRPISPIQDFLAYFELKKLIAELKPDIVHLNSSKVGVLGSMAARALKVPCIIYTAHGFVFNEPLSAFKRWLYMAAERGNARRVDAVIAVSEFDRQSGIKAGINKNKIITIHNGIDPDMHFLARDEARLSLQKTAVWTLPGGRDAFLPSVHAASGVEAAKLPRNDKLIGCIANFYPTKGPDVLIQAMTHVDAQLVIIGDGELRPQLEAQIKKLGLENRVMLAGYVPDAHQYLKAFDLFVLPSHKEGFPYVLLEAAAAGVPIVATRVGGIPEIVQDGVTGYLAEPNDLKALAQKISQALAHPLAPQLPNDCTLEHMLKETIRIIRM